MSWGMRHSGKTLTVLSAPWETPALSFETTLEGANTGHYTQT